MQNFLFFARNFWSQEISRLSASIFLTATLAVLAGCTAGPAPSASDTTGGTPATPSAPTITLALTNAAGATVSSISIDAPATVKATLKDAAGAVVPNAVVTFSTEATLVTITPAATALTDASGVATVTLIPATSRVVGAATITAAAQVGTVAVTGAISFAIKTTGISGEPKLTLALTSAGGVTVSSISSGAPATVKATLKDAAGAVIPNALVTFSTDATLATIIPAATALTDASGVATVTLKPATILAVGATSITAVAQVGTVTVTGAVSFAVETTAAPGAPTLTLALTNAAGATVNSISSAAPATVKATLRDAAGAVVPNSIVTFSTDATLATITPGATALTDTAGVATVTLRPQGIFSAGATSITAAARVGTVAVTGAINFAVVTTATPSEPTLTLALTNAAGATVSSISIGASATVKATLKDAAGAVVPNAIVTFSTDATLATITPAATALTDGSGVAKVTLNAATILTAGATTIKAAAQVGSVAVSSSIGFAVGVAGVTITAPVLGVSPLSAYGTTSITVTVSLGGVPVTTPQFVTFSSSCASVGKAVLSTGVATVAGVATGSYRDNGCAGADVITATAAGVTSPSTTLVITPPATGSIQFVSATPSIISLRGIGGTEAAQVLFRVLDGSGNPISGKTVTFDLTTRVGGITLVPASPPTAVSDASGIVVTTVHSGTVSTPVRVIASTPGAGGTTLTTQSSALTITTGIPDQDSISLGASTLNVEDIDGNNTVLTVRLGDHFNNPVPIGTVVNFTTEGGSIVGSCSTVLDSTGSSGCTSTLTVQAPRLAADGRYTVLAYAIGEESFTDLNGNGVADLVPNELVDQNGTSTDMSEAFRDDNENDVRDATEPFIDFNRNGVFDVPDGKYSGVLCDNVTPPSAGGSSPGTCAPTRGIHVRKSLFIVFSGSNAVITKIAPAGNITFTACTGAVPTQVDLRIVDERGSPMPAGTTITVRTTKGVLAGTDSSTQSFVQNNTNVAPATGTANYSVAIADVFIFGCETPPGGALTVTVKTPSGATSSRQFSIVN